MQAHTKLGDKLKRRCITLPFLAGAVVIGLVLAPLWWAWALSFDLLAKQYRKRPRVRGVCAAQLYILSEFAGVLMAGILWLFTAGGIAVGETRWVALNGTLQRWWTGTLFAGMVWIYGLRVEVEGLEEARRGPYLLFIRHTSMLDTVVAAALIANPHRILFRYVLKKELLSDPCLDIVGCRLPNAFIDRKARASDSEIGAIRGLTQGIESTSGILIYPEGTRFSRKKLERARTRLREKGLHELAERADALTHVLPPRLAGSTALMMAAPDLDVVIVEHKGFEAASSPARLWRGDLVGQTIRVRIRRFEAPQLAEGEHADWLYTRWEEVNAWVKDAS